MLVQEKKLPQGWDLKVAKPTLIRVKETLKKWKQISTRPSTLVEEDDDTEEEGILSSHDHDEDLRTAGANHLEES